MFGGGREDFETQTLQVALERGYNYINNKSELGTPSTPL
jgi:hypothetical protein